METVEVPARLAVAPSPQGRGQGLPRRSDSSTQAGEGEGAVKSARASKYFPHHKLANFPHLRASAFICG